MLLYVWHRSQRRGWDSACSLPVVATWRRGTMAANDRFVVKGSHTLSVQHNASPDHGISASSEISKWVSSLTFRSRWYEIEFTILQKGTFRISWSYFRHVFQVMVLDFDHTSLLCLYIYMNMKYNLEIFSKSIFSEIWPCWGVEVSGAFLAFE